MHPSQVLLLQCLAGVDVLRQLIDDTDVDFSVHWAKVISTASYFITLATWNRYLYGPGSDWLQRVMLSTPGARNFLAATGRPEGSPARS